MSANKIKIVTLVSADKKKVWECWTSPEHITKWNFASDDWHCPSAENDLRVGGKFNSKMEAKDGSFGFDFWGIYDEIIEFNKIAYTMGDGRKVVTFFEQENDKIKITTLFDPESVNSIEMQKFGWQSILDNFKKHVENPNVVNNNKVTAFKNPVVHFEMPYIDKDRISDFYTKAFGWKIQKLGEDMGNYITAQTTETDDKNMAKTPGTINGGFFQMKPDWPAQYPSVVIAVENIEEAIKNINNFGGKVLGEPMLIPGVGNYVAFFDTEGNRCSILQPISM